MDPRYVRAALARAAAKAGLSKRVHPHGLRHSHAFDLAETDVDVVVIKNQLGHDGLNTTQIYVDHLNPVERIERIRNRRPRAAEEEDTP